MPPPDAQLTAIIKAMSDEETTELRDQFYSLMDHIPDLTTDMQFYVQDEDIFLELINFLQGAVDGARRDDVRTMKGGTISLISNWRGQGPVTHFNSDKTLRGFNHPTIGRLLCPCDLLPDFDQNADRFCTQVTEGHRVIEAGDFPAFLYDETEYDSQRLDKGLLRSPYLVACFRYLFTGRSSAAQSGPGPSNIGRPSIAVKHKNRRVLPEMIAWAAVLVRFGLSSQSNWCLQDGAFDLTEFYKLIVGLFSARRSKWSIETLIWWNLKVWGPSSLEDHEKLAVSNRPTIAARLAQQRVNEDVSD
ncbi:hypothetical protein BDW22DRAFT_959387 [Trametopsis cervina]|nr:hypothetical protein BDW22DRAFT_959387 [Trametopsis cervina]